MNNWITALFKIGRRQNILNMFGRRRNNRGILWASILGMGISAAAYGFRRNSNINMLNSVQNLMNNFRFRNITPIPKMANLTEFSKELVPNKNSFTNK
ncbi:hypothetical protein [Bacillus sp. 7884-1]|uniref:hypothetical protein n=1 Tax=Bacillus sp. 7884-1 TaxID=2021693 RepID=UPI000BA6B5F1|nr:hypothetical protein [Bacillus sp. 7884-1]PAE33327.1 hypothetical protein CHI06_26080 [Bacillus sp. 7884-1]